METSKILSADLLDLIFDDRNKAYGAYELRRTYQKRITRALLITGTVAALAVTGTIWGQSMKPKEERAFDITQVTIEALPEEQEPLPEPERQQPEPEQVRTEQLSTIDIVRDEEVEEPPPTQAELEDARIDLVKRDGTDDDLVVDEPIDIGNGTDIIVQKKQEEEDKIYPIVEIPAKYAGNWEKFLLRNLNSNIPVDNGAAAGRYKVIIQFVVDKEGRVSDIRPLTNNGYGMEEEAMRVLKKSDQWEPAIQSGFKVKAYHKQVIVFEILED